MDFRKLLSSVNLFPSNSRRHHLAVRITLLFLLCVFAAGHATALQINVFGDSLSDSGNLFALSGGLIPPSPPYAGKASNGEVWVEQLASNLGAPAPNNVFATLALTNTINNFATVGAYSGSFAYPPPDGPGSSSNSSDRFLPAPVFPGLQEQIGLYSLLLGPGMADPNAVNIIWAGANDLVFAEFNGSTPAALAEPAVSNVRLAIEGLVGLGARSFVVINLPDIGRTPFGFFQTDGGTGLTDGSEQINEGLETMLSGLTSVNPTAQFRLVDIFALFEELIDAAAFDPEAAGFPDANTMSFMPPGLSFCLNQDAVPVQDFCLASNPDDRIFFDILHPSSRTHGVIAAAMESALVPAPAGYLLISIGLLAMVSAHRHRAA